MTLRIFQSLRLAKLLSRKTEGDARRHPAQRVDHRRWRGDLSSCVLGGPEGIVSKRIGSRYVSGQTRAWLKTKNPNFERR
jgi:ATP-dependent DNA ligase